MMRAVADDEGVKDEPGHRPVGQEAHARYWVAQRVRAWGLTLGAGALAGLATLPWAGGAFAAIAAWDAAALTLLVMLWWIILRSTPDMVRIRAATDDPGRTASFVIVLVASVASLAAAVVALRAPDEVVARDLAEVMVVLSVLAVACAWTMIHTAYTVRYAHLYYNDDGDPGGLAFPGTAEPSDRDFAYFAFLIGMTFQGADVRITQADMRWAALGHGVLSFAFNTVILAVTVSAVAAR